MHEPVSQTPANAELPSGLPNQITLPRWVVYFQGGLLGVVAVTFFVFGMLVGGVGRGPTAAAAVHDCEVRGRVLVESGLAPRGDQGAVVLFLPVHARPPDRLDPENLHPARFQPLDNPAIRAIHDWGGAVSRVDSRGEFQVVVDGPQDFDVVVISREQRRPTDDSLSRSQTAMLANWFLPRERLVGEQAVRVIRFSASGPAARLDDIAFQP